MAGVLEGITVLDLSRFVAGPYCGMLLADMGANVIKVEKKDNGDDTRGMGPFINKGGKTISLFFTQHNKNKKSVTVNFRSKKGIELLKLLISKADVLIENFRPGTLAKMGLTKEVMDALNPCLVTVSVSGFGQDGPYKDRSAFDCTIQAMSGLMSVTGERGQVPTMTGTWIADFMAGIYAAFGSVCALYNKDKIGKGDHVDISLFESVVPMLYTGIAHYMETGYVQHRNGNRDRILAPANMFKTKKGYLYIHAGSDTLFKTLAGIMGRQEMIIHPHYKTSEKRLEYAAEIESIISEWLSDYTAEEAERMLVSAGIPCSKVKDIADLTENPQFKHRKCMVTREQPEPEDIVLPGTVVKMSRNKNIPVTAPPCLGEHNMEVYQEILGLSVQEIETLMEEGVI